MYGTPHRDDAVRITSDTEAEELRKYAKRQARNPIELDDGVLVWNFSTHEPDMDALQEVADDLKRDRYVIPYQLAGGWAYFERVLPSDLYDAEFLVYSATNGRYKAFKNFRRTADPREDEAVQRGLEGWVKAKYTRRIENDA